MTCAVVLRWKGEEEFRVPNEDEYGWRGKLEANCTEPSKP